MSQPFQAVKISDRVYWVGAIDWGIRDFHGYLTSRGTTYNAYLILGDTVTLVDTVKRPFYDEMLSRIASVVEPSRIETIVSHHAELDHSACLPDLTKLVQPSRVITSKAGVDALARHFKLDVPVQAVTPGSATNVGGANLIFHDTRMLHWPESMVSYLEGDDVFFTQDVFGLHLASLERWADELPAHLVDEETAKYFANILMPFAAPVGKALGKLGELARGAKVLANDHGPLWRGDVTRLLDNYRRWCDRTDARRIVIAYASMWQSTATMARVISEGARDAGGTVSLFALDTSHRSDIATALLDASTLVVGTPNLNGQMYPTVADLMSYVRGLNPRGLVGGVFGSYGWSPSALDQVVTAMQAMKMEVVGEPVAVKFVPNDADLEQCRAFGRRLVERG